jgi:hypothetical protein
MGALAEDLARAFAFADPAAADHSPLLTKTAGLAHGGGTVFETTSSPYAVLARWVRDTLAAGASSSPRPTATPGPGGPPPGAPAATPAIPGVPGARPPRVSPGGAGVALPLGLHLNGRFDLSYERLGFTGNPLSAEAANALRSYHQFLFLTRQVPADPFGLTIELVTRQFWEGHVRFTGHAGRWQALVRAGKILVPFGIEPPFHQYYGGLAGFDQRVLPVIWAQEGIAGHLLAPWRERSLSFDLFAVRGHRLRAPDGILNLQNDFSPNDDIKPGLGGRWGASWGPISGWYSLYFNPLGFGRRLFMQALDVSVWRLRGVPILERFSFAAGLLRADVAGAGAGHDYYHFASYGQVRLWVTDFLYLQYRQGLRTFENKRGLYADRTRYDSQDGSTHTVGLVARHRGLTTAVSWFWNLEKADEIPDDFLRVSLTYEF